MENKPCSIDSFLTGSRESFFVEQPWQERTSGVLQRTFSVARIAVLLTWQHISQWHLSKKMIIFVIFSFFLFQTNHFQKKAKTLGNEKETGWPPIQRSASFLLTLMRLEFQRTTSLRCFRRSSSFQKNTTNTPKTLSF